jgi:hypothetical protein
MDPKTALDSLGRGEYAWAPGRTEAWVEFLLAVQNYEPQVLTSLRDDVLPLWSPPQVVTPDQIAPPEANTRGEEDRHAQGGSTAESRAALDRWALRYRLISPGGEATAGVSTSRAPICPGITDFATFVRGVAAYTLSSWDLWPWFKEKLRWDFPHCDVLARLLEEGAPPLVLVLRNWHRLEETRTAVESRLLEEFSKQMKAALDRAERAAQTLGCVRVERKRVA